MSGLYHVLARCHFVGVECLPAGFILIVRMSHFSMIVTQCCNLARMCKEGTKAEREERLWLTELYTSSGFLVQGALFWSALKGHLSA